MLNFNQQSLNNRSLSFGNIMPCIHNDNVNIGAANSQRPIFHINILGFNGTALVDTAAKCCVAGHTLYKILCQRSHPMHEKF